MADTRVAAISFENLSRRHVALMDDQADEHLAQPEVRSFVADAAAAGVQIESIGDRDAVRSMINYWTATLARLPEARAGGDTEPPAMPDRAGVLAAAIVPTPVARPTLASFDAGQSPSLPDSANPFMGLAAFDSGDSFKFFGREAVVADLLKLVLASSVVVVSGASGTGKSSLVRAGLVSALQRAPGYAGWIVATSVPGRDPIASLAAALAPSGAAFAEWVDHFRQQMDVDPSIAGAITDERMAGHPLLLVVDQMEELFSLCQPEDRDRAARAIGAIAALPQAHVVVTIRDEYLETERSSHVLPGLDLAAAAEFRVPPLQIEDIRAAILQPAADVGLVFQDGVVDRIVADVGTDPAALPLLQYALLRLWKKRDGNRITTAVYDKVGGPSTALSNAAQEIYDGLGSTQAKENARLIFQQLVRPSLTYEFVRDRVSRAELERLLPPDSIKTVLAPFVAAALIRILPGADRSEDRIEIVHEALIRNWEPLRRWALEVRDRERAFLSLDAQAQRWQDSGKALGHLMFGRALRDAELAFEAYRARARVDPVSDRRVAEFLKVSRVSQRSVLGTASAAAILVLLAAMIGFAAILYLRQDAALEALAKDAGIKQVANLSEISGSRGEQALASSVDEDAGRQFVQMLVSRGTIAPSELPPAFSGMTATAAAFSPNAIAPIYTPNFLGLSAPIEPKLAGVRPATLDNMRVFFDAAGGVPRLIVSRYDRSQPSSADAGDALYRWPGLAGQPDEIALAKSGIGLAHLVDRREVAWGPHAAAAARGANLIATMVPLGAAASRNAAFDAWPLLQAWMRVNHNPDAARILFFTGAVPGDGPVGTTIPKYLWKVALSSDGKGGVVIDAAMLPSVRSASGDLPGRTTIDVVAKVAGFDAQRLRRLLATAVAAPPATAAAHAAPMPLPAPPAESPAATTRVFIEAKGLTTDVEKALSEALRTQQFTVPRIQHVDPCIVPAEIRYYFRQDAEAAARASGIAGAAARAAGLGDGTVNLRRLDPNRYTLARTGTIELWLCGAGTPSAASAAR